MTIFVALVLTVLTFVLVAYPFFKPRSRLAASVEDETQRELYSKRDTAYSMLKELEFDFQSGILTEEDYRDLEARYKRKAISILKDVDTLEKGTDVEDEIEKRVLALRHKKGTRETAAGDGIEKEVLALRQSKGQFCSKCGAKHEKDDRFCSYCGAKLK